MVKSFGFPVWFAASALLAGCDPFAPSEPEPPSLAGNSRTAKTASQVPDVWAQGLAEGNIVQVLALVGEGFRGTSGGKAFTATPFSSCAERLVKEGIDSSRFTWSGIPSGGVDTLTGDVDWSLRQANGTRWNGKATWSVARSESLEWHLLRWNETSAPGNWSDLCGGL
ncbi:MAG: hypothetical protein H6686_00480 [Fibrobacteria bacterium]|nr:hypothetical protein [Fibrobacteria bacterium]